MHALAMLEVMEREVSRSRSERIRPSDEARWSAICVDYLEGLQRSGVFDGGGMFAGRRGLGNGN